MPDYLYYCLDILYLILYYIRVGRKARKKEPTKMTVNQYSLTPSTTPGCDFDVLGVINTFEAFGYANEKEGTDLHNSGAIHQVLGMLFYSSASPLVPVNPKGSNSVRLPNGKIVRHRAFQQGSTIWCLGIA
jgi:hypothetical protein